MAVLGQPRGMEMQQGFAGLPPALNYLASIDQLIVKQKKELLEILTGFETANKYEIYNNMKQQIFFVAEESSTMQRMCCAPNRAFQLHVLDNSSQEVAKFSREFACCKGCCWCADGSCGWQIDIEAPLGHRIGYVRQRTSKCSPHYSIHDQRNTHLFTIWGPCCICQDVCCPEDVEFPITTPDLRKRVGCVAKQWRGCCAENWTDADTFSVTFPVDLPLESKVLMFGACFMVDYMNFENQGGGGGGGA